MQGGIFLHDSPCIWRPRVELGPFHGKNMLCSEWACIARSLPACMPALDNLCQEVCGKLLLELYVVLGVLLC